jgi:hypothetical protein
VFRSDDRAARASRPLLRAFAFAGIALPVSLVGHVAAGGMAPDPATFLLACVLTALGYRLVLAGRERSWPVLATSLGVAEWVLHSVFMSGGSMPRADSLPGEISATPFFTADAQLCGMLTPGMPGMTTMDGHPGPAAASGGGSDLLGGITSGLATSVMGMLVAHLAAAVVLGWFLRQGERALWTAARRILHAAGRGMRRLRSVLARSIGCAVVAVRPRVCGMRRARWYAQGWLSRHLTTGGRFWRGPPRAACAA